MKTFHAFTVDLYLAFQINCLCYSQLCCNVKHRLASSERLSCQDFEFYSFFLPEADQLYFDFFFIYICGEIKPTAISKREQKVI